MSAGLRKLASSAAAACNSMTSVQSADTLTYIMTSVISAHYDTCLYTSDKVVVGKFKYDTFMCNKPPGWDVEGIKSRLDNSDADPALWWQQFVDNMSPVIKRVVAFCRRIPGFLELSQADQITLVRQGSFELIFARYTPLFSEEGMFLPDMTARIPRSMIKLMPMGDFFYEQCEFADKFNLLHLTDPELALLSAVMILNPERTGLADMQSVYKLQGLYLQCLYVYMKYTRPDTYDQQYWKTVGTLPLLNRINEIHSNEINSAKITSPHITFPELHNEVFPK